MNKIAILSIALISTVILVFPNAYAEDGDFFDWLANLFSGFTNDKDVEPEVSVYSEIEIDTKKAAIIDQLSKDIPNKYFQDKTMEYFTTAGYEVDLYKYEDITIDFYKNLPSMDYKFIVVRSHALAIDGDKPSSWKFTGEKYTEKKYIQEQLAGDIISRAVPYRVTQAQDVGFESASKDRHFIVSAKFVKDFMIGKFPGSVIILGGCDTMELSDFGHAFINRGATSVIGWNGLIDSDSNDKVLMSLIEKILIEKSEVDDAVDSVMVDYLKDKKTSIRLKHLASGAALEI